MVSRLFNLVELETVADIHCVRVDLLPVPWRVKQRGKWATRRVELGSVTTKHDFDVCMLLH